MSFELDGMPDYASLGQWSSLPAGGNVRKLFVFIPQLTSFQFSVQRSALQPLREMAPILFSLRGRRNTAGDGCATQVHRALLLMRTGRKQMRFLLQQLIPRMQYDFEAARGSRFNDCNRLGCSPARAQQNLATAGGGQLTQRIRDDHQIVLGKSGFMLQISFYPAGGLK